MFQVENVSEGRTRAQTVSPRSVEEGEVGGKPWEDVNRVPCMGTKKLMLRASRENVFRTRP